MSQKRIHWFAWICWLGVVIWTGTVFWLSSRGGDELTQDFPFIIEAWDKFLHFIAFFCGILPLVPAFRLSTEWPWKKIFWMSVAWISCYGALDEVHQVWTPSRSGLSVGDWIADTLGGLTGAVVAVAIHKRMERRASSNEARRNVRDISTASAIQDESPK